MATPGLRAAHQLTDAVELVGRVELENGGIVVLEKLTFVEVLTEAVVRQDLGAGLGTELRCATEVVEMRVGDHRRVHVAQRETRSRQAVEQGVPRGQAGQARVDDRNAPLVFEEVAVHVPEPGQLDRELCTEHARRDLGDLVGGRLLFLLGDLLLARHGGHPRPSASTRRPCQRARRDRFRS